MDRPSLLHRPSTAVVLLFSVVACLGTDEPGKGCACRTETPPAASGLPATPEPAAPLVPSAPALAPESAEEPGSLPDFSDPSWTRTASRQGRYLVCWRSSGGPIPRNEDFTLEVWVLRDGVPVRDAFLAVNAWMPDHGHGMLRQPRAEAQDDGSYRISGMLLHMRGHWQLFFEVLEGNLSETAECALEL